MTAIARINYYFDDDRYVLTSGQYGNEAEVPEDTLKRWERIQDEYEEMQVELHKAYIADTTKHSMFCHCAGCRQ